jgi:flagellar basal-body rod protein FlgB
MVGKLDEYLRFHETALSLRSQRQQVLASNIANADTPEYKARDIDFAGALQAALGVKPPPGPLALSSARHFTGLGANGGAATSVPGGSGTYGAYGTAPGVAAAMPTGEAPLAQTAARHLAPLVPPAIGPDGAPLLYRTPAQGAIDGNTVDMDVERNQFADNAIRYEAGITMLNHQIKAMLAAIQGAQ